MLQVNSEANLKDAKLFAEAILDTRVAPTLKADAVNILVNKSKGYFQYLAAVADNMPPRLDSVSYLKKLPPQLKHLYLQFFKELQEPALGGSIGGMKGFEATRTMSITRGLSSLAGMATIARDLAVELLHVLAAAREPPTVQMLCWMLGGADEDAVMLLLDCLSRFYLLQPEDGHLYVVAKHKTVVDFLTDKKRSGKFYVNIWEAHRRLAEACIESAGRSDLSELVTSYIEQHVAAHMQLSNRGFKNSLIEGEMVCLWDKAFRWVFTKPRAAVMHMTDDQRKEECDFLHREIKSLCLAFPRVVGRELRKDDLQPLSSFLLRMDSLVPGSSLDIHRLAK